MAACDTCGTDIPEGGRFCPSCGAAAPAPEPEGGSCASCGAPLKPGARFCAGCGTAVASAAQPPAAPSICAGCGQELAPRRSFCTNCGTPAAGTPPATPTATPVQPPAPSRRGFPTPSGSSTVPRQPVARQPATHPAGSSGGRLNGPQIGTLIAFAAAAISTALPWVSGGGIDFNTWDDGARFRFGDWFSLDNGDGYIVILVTIIGAAAVLGPLLSSSFPRIQFGPAVVGAAILVVAGLEWQFINDRGLGLDPAYGVYVLGAAGIAGALLGYTADKAPPLRR